MKYTHAHAHTYFRMRCACFTTNMSYPVLNVTLSQWSIKRGCKYHRYHANSFFITVLNIIFVAVLNQHPMFVGNYRGNNCEGKVQGISTFIFITQA